MGFKLINPNFRLAKDPFRPVIEEQWTENQGGKHCRPHPTLKIILPILQPESLHLARTKITGINKMDYPYFAYGVKYEFRSNEPALSGANY